MSEVSSAEAVAPAPIFAPRAFTAQIPSVLAVLTLLACCARRSQTPSATESMFNRMP